jgi:hypothetical protein
MQQLQGQLASIVDIAATAASQPASVQQLAVNHARDAMAQASGVARQLSQQGVETFSKKGDAKSVLRAHLLYGQMQDDARLAARAAEAYARQLRQALPYAQPPLSGEGSRLQSPPPGSIQAVYRTRQGDTLARISQLFYKSPDHVVDLARANGLSWMTPSFPVGTILVIPTLPAATNPNAT